MASVWITEFGNTLGNGAGLFPAVASQVIELEAGGVAYSKPFHQNTIMVRINTDAPCLLSIGLTATDDPVTMRMNPSTEYFGVSGSLILSVKALP